MKRVRLWASDVWQKRRSVSRLRRQRRQLSRPRNSCDQARSSPGSSSGDLPPRQRLGECYPPFRRAEGRSEVLRLVRHIRVGELHDAHGVARHPVVGDDALAYPQISAADDPDGAAICAPTTNAATSGGSPAALEQGATQVASGTIAGEPWSLWSENGQSGATALEDGGLVLGGNEYGLCPGYPNPSETEMIDTGGEAVIYGVVNYPGLAKVTIGTGSQGFTMDAVLPSPQVAVVDGVSFYIGTLASSACAYSYLVIDTTSPSASAEDNIGFGENGVGQGYSITNNPGNTGACTTGKLDPLSFSQGEWDLPPGQFNSGR
jgi:hypothetical protein